MSAIERLSTVGVTVTIGTHQLLGAVSTGDFGAEPNMIDASCLLDAVDVQVLGRQSQGAWSVQYIYNDADGAGDFSAMEALAAQTTTAHAVEVAFPNGAKFANTGYLSNYANGVEDNGVLRATVTLALQGKWTYTAPTSGGNG